MHRGIVVGIAVVWLLSGMVTPLRAQQNAELSKRIETLEKQLQELKSELKKQAGAASKKEAESQERTKTLGEELESLKLKVALPETKELKGQYGLGPAASKVYGVERGLSIGGYGQAWLQTYVADNEEAKKEDVFDYKRFVLYVGYKFTDRIILNSELEFEHASTSNTGAGSGSVSVEFASLDFLLTDIFNVRAGMLLVPMGFLNELHEPPFYLGNERPEVERQIIPSTWRENGAGIFGTLAPGLEYRSYLVTSLDAADFKNSNIRSARQKGNRAKAEDFSWVTRVDYSPPQIPGLLVGTSVYWGDQGHSLKHNGKELDVDMLFYDFHAQYQLHGLYLRGLFTQAHIGDAELLSRFRGSNGPISERIQGWYVEAGYDIMPLFDPSSKHALIPFYRHEEYDTQASVPSGFVPKAGRHKIVNTFGVNYKPHPNVVIKADMRLFESNKGTEPDDFNIGVGFAF